MQSQKDALSIGGNTMEAQQFTVESFTTGERRAVTATNWEQALADQPESCFLLVCRHDGRYAARSLENDAFPVAGEHVADTPEDAADSMRQAYTAIKSASPKGQPPVNAPQYRVLYLKEGKEERGPWMSKERAHEAAAMMRAKYGERNVTVYMD